MNIKKVSGDDWEKFREIRLAGIRSDPQALGGDLTEEIGRKETEWRKRLESPDRFFFVVEDTNIFVSVAGSIKIDTDRWMLVGVYTLPSFRGKGFAQRLTQEVITECKNRQASVIQLMVNLDQKDAVHMYKKSGFTIIKTIKDEKMADDKFHDEYLMEKSLIDNN